MREPALPPDEAERLAALRRYEILDTAPEPNFDRVPKVAKAYFGVPMAWVSFVDADRQWFKSCAGLDLDETSRDVSFCAHAILSDAVTVVPDASKDERFAGNPFVEGPPYLRFFLGAPLTTPDGYRIGTLCVADSTSRPRPPGKHVQVLADLAAMVVDELELRLASRRHEAAQLASAQLAAIVESSNDPIMSMDLDGTIQSWNAAAEELYGYGAGEIVGRQVSVLVPEDCPDDIERILAEVRRGERVQHYQTRRVARSGEVVEVVLSVSPVRDAAGTIVGAATIARDVTARNRANEVLRRQAAALSELAELLELTDDAVVVRDASGRIAFWNGGAERRYGWTREEAIGRVPHELFNTEFPAPREELEAILRRDGRWEGELVHTTRRGDRIVVASRWALRPAEGDRPESVLAISTDVTERKRAEAELAAAKEEAERASDAKSAFLANMSHEIRTPMNGVLGMTALLLETDLTDEQRSFAETVRTSAEALLTVINDILDFSKVEAGKMELEEIPFDVGVAVEEAAGLLAERADAKGLELVTSVSPDIPRVVRGDPGRIRQVLINLVSNAVKFTDTGEIVVTVRAEAVSSEQVVVRFEVRDSGVGIDAGTIGRLFSSFSQADASTTRRFGGTGLGLAICRRLTELMGGHIGVESEPGEGSTFWFSVPLRRGEDTALERPRRGSLQGLRVLVVDDNATNRDVLVRTVARWGMRPEAAASGPDALAALRDSERQGEPFALALVDYRMDGMDGIEVGRAVRADPHLAGVRLVMLTSSGIRGDARVAREAGYEAFLTKPVRQSALYDCLATVMGADPGDADRPLVTRHSLAEAAAAAMRGRLLVAEDNVVNQQVAARMLERLGYRVDVVSNGAEAVEAVACVPYAAVLMDCHMPEMDGYQATAAIRRLSDDRARVPVIALTAGAMKDDEERCLALGMDDYLTKPVVIESLEAVLDRWVGNVSAYAPVPAQAVCTAGDAGGALDEAVMAGLRSLDDADEAPFLDGLVATFLEAAAERLVAMRDAAAAGDAVAVSSIAHTLKGSSANLGALRLASVCGDLERAAAAGECDSVAALFPRLDHELDLASRALRAVSSASRRGRTREARASD